MAIFLINHDPTSIISSVDEYLMRFNKSVSSHMGMEGMTVTHAYRISRTLCEVRCAILRRSSADSASTKIIKHNMYQVPV